MNFCCIFCGITLGYLVHISNWFWFFLDIHKHIEQYVAAGRGDILIIGNVEVNEDSEHDPDRVILAGCEQGIRHKV